MADAFDLPPIQFTPAGETDEAREEVLNEIEPSPGFPAVAELLVESIRRQAFTTVLDYTQHQATVRFQIDGLWHAGKPMDRERGDYLLVTLKKLAGLNDQERRARQEGNFGTLYKKVKQKVRVVSQGVKTGERVAIYLDWKREIPETVEQLGMRASMIKQLVPILNDPNTGLVLVSAVPGEGYTSAWRGALSICDRLTRDYFVIEETNAVEPEVINFTSITFDRAAGQTAMSPIERLLLKQPDVLAFPELPDAATINSVVNLSSDQDMPIFVRSPGKGCLDALLRLMVMKPKNGPLLERLNCIVAMRLLRKLCQKCRVPYKPHPGLLQKLGLPPGRISELYRPFVWQPGLQDEKENEIMPCRSCFGIGYAGRTGIFEMLVLTENLRIAIQQSPNLNQLNALAQSNGHISMQQEGIVLVARGLTSIEELQRVLKS